MKKDIEIPDTKNVRVAVVRKKKGEEHVEWNVYIINNYDRAIENTIVASKGYGANQGEQQRTSTLRHFLETIPAHAALIVEPIDPAVFHLNNEYFVTYYLDGKLHDKQFLFGPDVICEENIVFIRELEMEGVLHF